MSGRRPIRSSNRENSYIYINLWRERKEEEKVKGEGQYLCTFSQANTHANHFDVMSPEKESDRLILE